MTGPAAKEQDNDADEKPVKKSVKTLGKRQRPIERQPAKVRRNAKREAKNLSVEEEKVMPATEKKETRGRKTVNFDKYVVGSKRKLAELDAELLIWDP